MQLLRSNNAHIFLALLSRDIKLLGLNLKSLFIDCLAPLITQILTFGYLFPLLGMPSSMIAPVYIGSMISLFMQLGFTFVVKTSYDITFNKYIEYQIILPIAKRWLFAQIIVSNMIEIALITIPFYTIGIFILRSQFNLVHANWIALPFVFMLILLFFASFFLTIAYSFSLPWILSNAWPRILVPLWWISAGLFIWKKVYAWWPLMGYAMLFSPFTFVAEGLRACLLGNEHYIPWQWCSLALLAGIILNIMLLQRGIKKRLDPV